jgi:Amidase
LRPPRLRADAALREQRGVTGLAQSREALLAPNPDLRVPALRPDSILSTDPACLGIA